MSRLQVRRRARRLRHGLDYGRMVHERYRFALREAANVSTIGEYRPLGGAFAISLQHHYSPDGTPSNDTWTLREIFRDDCYVPPPPIDAMLRELATPSILDVGANVGAFASFILGRYPTADLVAIEPDPQNARLLKAALAGSPASSTVHQACAAAQAGSVAFAHGRQQFCHVADTAEEDTVTVSAIDALPLFEGVDLAKIDIEGGEWELVGDARFASLGPRALVMEYHARSCPEPDARRCAERLLTASGYEVSRRPGAPPDEPILWAARRGRPRFLSPRD